MKVQIFESIKELQTYLENKNRKNIDVKFHAEVVATKKDGVDNKVFEILDRFLVLED